MLLLLLLLLAYSFMHCNCAYIYIHISVHVVFLYTTYMYAYIGVESTWTLQWRPAYGGVLLPYGYWRARQEAEMGWGPNPRWQPWVYEVEDMWAVFLMGRNAREGRERRREEERVRVQEEMRRREEKWAWLDAVEKGLAEGKKKERKR